MQSLLDHLSTGRLIAGRYELVSELGADDQCSVWRCRDVRLDRQVVLRMFDPKIGIEILQRQSGMAASLTHPRVVRVFDTGFDSGLFFVVSELLPSSLGWTKEPMSVDETRELGIEVTAGLAHAHERGIAHGNIHPGSVLLGEQGAKLGGFCLSGKALSGQRPRVSQDLPAVGRLLYHALTQSDENLNSISPGFFSRSLDAEARGVGRVIGELLDGRCASALDAHAALVALRTPGSTPALRTSKRKWFIAAFAALLILLVAGLFQLGDQHKPARDVVKPVQGAPVRIVSVADFDPKGDGREGRRTVQKIYDSDPRTFWSTERYQDGSKFGGIKNGAGVILNLGSPRLVGKAQIRLVAPGCSFELRHASRRWSKLDGWETAVSRTRAGRTTNLSFANVRAQWWLLWITELTTGVPGSDDAYACGVSEAIIYTPLGS